MPKGESGNSNPNPNSGRNSKIGPMNRGNQFGGTIPSRQPSNPDMMQNQITGPVQTQAPQMGLFRYPEMNQRQFPQMNFGNMFGNQGGNRPDMMPRMFQPGNSMMGRLDWRPQGQMAPQMPPMMAGNDQMQQMQPMPQAPPMMANDQNTIGQLAPQMAPSMAQPQNRNLYGAMVGPMMV